MLRSLIKSSVVAVSLLGPSLGLAGDFYGNFLSGAYNLAGDNIRLFAFVTQGPLNLQAIQNEVEIASRTLDQRNLTHEYKDGNGNYNQLQLAHDKILVIGF
jgi:hypothetical protein